MSNNFSLARGRLLLLIVLMLSGLASAGFAQTGGVITNTGYDYWVCFPSNAPSGFSSDTTHPSLYLVSGKATTVKVEYLSVVKTYLLKVGIVTKVMLPRSVEISTHRQLEKKGIHVYSTDSASFTLYGVSARKASTDGYVGLATDLAGLAYTVTSYTSLGTVYSSSYDIVAIEDSTKVIITYPKLPGVPPLPVFAMNKGDVYQVLALQNNPATDNVTDVTGYVIVATHPINVFGGHQCARVPTTISNCDFLVESLFPMDLWGTTFHVLPLAGRARYLLRIVAGADANLISINGVQRPLALFGRGDHFDTILTAAATVCSDDHIQVMQYALGTADDESLGDPLMMTIAPDIHGTDGFYVTTPDQTLSTPLDTPFTANYINLIVPEKQKANVLLDGKLIPDTLFSTTFPAGDVVCASSEKRLTFVGARISVRAGLHAVSYKTPPDTTEIRSLFGYSYGWKNADAYGYPAGLGNPVLGVTPDSIPNITVLVPNGGERWRAGSRKAITWESERVQRVNIQLSTDGGSTFETSVATNVASVTGVNTDSLSVPLLESTECKIRIADTTTNSPAMDMSDKNFTIYIAPPAFTSQPVTTAKIGIFYTYTATTYDSAGLAVTIVAPTRPPWTSFADPTLSGTPVAVGVDSVVLVATNTQGKSSAQRFVITTKDPLSVHDGEDNAEIGLLQNYPNPFSEVTTIEILGKGIFEVRDMLGRLVYHSTINDDASKLLFNGRKLPNGLYKYSLSDGMNTFSRMMVVMK